MPSFIFHLLLMKIEFNFPPIDIAPVHMKFILASPNFFEICLILKATCQNLQHNQILYRQNRYVEFTKDNDSSAGERCLEIIRVRQQKINDHILTTANTHRPPNRDSLEHHGSRMDHGRVELG